MASRNMPDKLKLFDLLALPKAEQDRLLRITIFNLLYPGPHEHLWIAGFTPSDDYFCAACGVPLLDETNHTPCSGGTVTASWPDLVEKLKEHARATPHFASLIELIDAVQSAITRYHPRDVTANLLKWYWYGLKATAREQAIIILMAMGEIQYENMEVKHEQS